MPHPQILKKKKREVRLLPLACDFYSVSNVRTIIT